MGFLQSNTGLRQKKRGYRQNIRLATAKGSRRSQGLSFGCKEFASSYDLAVR